MNSEFLIKIYRKNFIPKSIFISTYLPEDDRSQYYNFHISTTLRPEGSYQNKQNIIKDIIGRIRWENRFNGFLYFERDSITSEQKNNFHKTVISADTVSIRNIKEKDSGSFNKNIAQDTIEKTKFSISPMSVMVDSQLLWQPLPDKIKKDILEKKISEKISDNEKKKKAAETMKISEENRVKKKNLELVKDALRSENNREEIKLQQQIRERGYPEVKINAHIFKEGLRTITSTAIIYENQKDVFLEIKYNWGGTFYFMNGKNIPKDVYDVEISRW